MLALQTLPLPTVIQIVAKTYGVPQRAILGELAAVSRKPEGIGPMGIASRWLPNLRRAGFSVHLVKTNPQWNVAAGAWVLAKVLHTSTKQPSMTVHWQSHPVLQLTKDLERASATSGLPAPFLAAVMMQESGGNPDARSSKGAMGLMQLMPDTAAQMGVRDPWSPAQNLVGGAMYLAHLLQDFGDNPELALAAYNAGPQAVRQYGGIPPYPQTQAYVPAVLANYRRLDHP